MRSPAPALLPIFRSEHQATLLAHLYLRPEEEFTLSDLANRLGASMGGLHAEVQRLVAAGLILDRREGRNRLVRANTGSRLARALTELLTVTYGPQIVIAEEFIALEKVDKVVVYGSWARRFRGQVGREPADVDVMVIGSPDREDVFFAADRAERRLKIPVNTTVRSSTAWTDGTDGLVITARRDAVPVLVSQSVKDGHGRHLTLAPGLS